MRILVWMEVELDIKKAVKEIYTYAEEYNSKEQFYAQLKEVFNKTETFDSHKNIEALNIFLEKIRDWSLEIRKTLEPNHSKLYLFEKKTEYSEWGNFPGTLITWSSNLTYSWLRWRYECNVVLRDKDDYDAWATLFEDLWNQALPITTGWEEDPVIKILKEETWLKIPQPYYCFIRLLDEYFGDKYKRVHTPENITNGQFKDLTYQVDAIKKWLKIIEEHNGVMIADVVGLGKSIIGSALLSNLWQRAIIICPPHLKPQWEDYKKLFDLDFEIFTSGKIEEALRESRKYPDRYKVLLVDEAHRYRNADTIDYGNLHQLAQGKKVILLTATPFNNSPADIFNLIRLFQIPKKSTIQTHRMLSYEFRDLQNDYDKIKLKIKKKEISDEEWNRELKKIAQKIKHIIHPVVVRRSRVDLRQRNKYREDMEKNNMNFSLVAPPKTQEYSLGIIESQYIETITDLLDVWEEHLKNKKFSCSRYTLLTYLTPEAKSQYLPKFIELFSTNYALIEWRQKNMPLFVTRQLVWRFESCIGSFKKTIDNMIISHKNLEKWLNKGIIPIIRKWVLPTEDELQEDLTQLSEWNDLQNTENREQMDKALEKFGGFWIDSSDLDVSFRQAFDSDLAFLESLKNKWEMIEEDPKWKFLLENLYESRRSDPKRKIIIFTQFADTAVYLNELLNSGWFRVMMISGGTKTRVTLENLRANFDAGIPDWEQRDDYDVLIATDAISEWYNLHRAGLIINYDIPYNPTVVIQRIGRINRINKKVFETLYIYNYFPSLVWEGLIGVERISKLKVKMIGSILWSDTQVLSEDETLDSFYGRMLENEDESNEESWETEYENIYDTLSQETIVDARRIPHRSRVLRKPARKDIWLITYAKRWSVNVFGVIDPVTQEVQTITDEDAFALFRSEAGEEGFIIDEQFYPLYDTLKYALFRAHTGGQSNTQVKKALDTIDAFSECFAKEYRKLLKKVINEYDSLPDQYMRSLREINEHNHKELIPLFISQVSLEYLRSIDSQARDFDELSQDLIMSEQFV